jgi:ribosomal protein S18 acetylase RimI-like enzyme
MSEAIPQQASGTAGAAPRLRQFQFPQDYEAVVALWRRAGPGIHVRRSDQPEEIRKKLERDPDLFLLVEVGDRIVGSVMGGFDGRRGMMYHLAVDQAYRERGIGAMLVDELERRLRAKGCIRYYLMVTYENQQAIEFYEKRGWERMNLYTYGKDL